MRPPTGAGHFWPDVKTKEKSVKIKWIAAAAALAIPALAWAGNAFAGGGCPFCP